MQGVSDDDSTLKKGRRGSHGDDAHRGSGKDQIDVPS
jgi:hypothetical protein